MKNIPGSHVIIDSPDPSEDTLQEAGNLAAYFSKARLSAAVPVDYIQVKKIKKTERCATRVCDLRRATNTLYDTRRATRSKAT